MEVNNGATGSGNGGNAGNVYALLFSVQSGGGGRQGQAETVELEVT